MKRVIRYAAAAVALGALLFPLSASAWGNRSWWRADYYDAYGARIGAEGRYCWGSYYSWGDVDPSNPNMTYDEGSCEIGPLEP
jgi:hypothetical protein